MARTLPLLSSLGMIALGPLHAATTSPEQLAYFENEIRPLLVEHCYKCHSQEEGSRIKGGLLLDSTHGWQAGGDSGEAIVPGAPNESLLVTAVRYQDADLQMPPKYRLKDKEIAALEEWVAMGAPDPRTNETVAPTSEINIEEGRQFWAFQLPKDLEPPKVKQSTWPETSIDQFILAQLEAKDLHPAPDADRVTLIRRASFDLIGLPPTPEEIDAFINDDSPDKEAFSKVVDRLLKSTHFGERWGRHWLDVVRYAESTGRTRNYPFPYAWRYRNYVIDAFNADKPYDQFIREQIAGDLLPYESEEQRDHQRIATGFLALGSMDLNERDKEQYRMDVVDEQIDVTGRAVLALTTGCARCHDHKFDPIPETDYYALAGIFRSTNTLSGYTNRQGGNRASFKPELLATLASVPATVVAQEKVNAAYENAQKKVRQLEKQLKAIDQQVVALGKTPKANKKNRRKKNKGKTIAATPPSVGEQRKALQDRQKKLRQQLGKARRSANMVGNKPTKGKNQPTRDRMANYSMAAEEHANAEDCKINIRGDARQLGATVPRGFLQVLCEDGVHEISDKSTSGRLEFAQWLTAKSNPLTARVMANRAWHHLFGQGLVPTVDNFGQMGERPSHPALLDHLAHRFMNSDWSIKDLVRDLMLSKTYRMSSAHNDAAEAIDPNNRLVWRMSVRRLQVEPLRDAMLTVSGRLSTERPEGSPVMSTPISDMRKATQNASPENMTCRTVYLPVFRGFVPQVFQAFDFAEPSQVMGRRDVTTVSTQALYFMNNEFVIKESEHSAKRLLAERLQEDRLNTAYQWTLGRKPTTEEAARATAYLTDIESPKLSSAQQWGSLFQALFASAEFRYLQ